MSGDLYLFPVPDEPGAFDVARVRGAKVAFARASAQAPIEAGGDRVVLVAPGEDVALHELSSSLRSDVQALAAARFAIEDDLAEPIEDVEVALGPRRPKRPREAFVVSRARLARWREELAVVVGAPDLIVPDYALLAVEEGTLLAIDLGGRVIVRGPGVGFAADSELAPAILDATLARLPGLGIRLCTSYPDALLPHAAREGRRVELEPAPDGEALIALLRRGVEDGPAVDLAQIGQRKTSGGLPGVRSWRLAGGVAAAAAAAFLALLGAQTLALRSHTEALRADADAALRAAFPDLAAGDARAALRSRLTGAGGGSASFLDLSAILSAGVGEVGAMEIESLRFDQADGQLAASVVYGAYDDVQRLKAAVEARGASVTEGASRMQGGRMAGEITVAAR